jgi:hypothetical protein
VYLDIKTNIIKQKGVMKGFGKYWGFIARPENYRAILDIIRKDSILVHTLEDHLSSIGSFYGPEIKPLGPNIFVSLPAGTEWQYLDNVTRLWTYMNCFTTGGNSAANIRGGSILRCNQNGMLRYFKLESLGTKLHPLGSKRAAYNLAMKYFLFKKIYWIPHDKYWVIPIHQLGMLPDEVFDCFSRMRPFPGVLDGLLVFAEEDLGIVTKFMRSIKIGMVRSSKMVQLPNDKSKVKGTPLIPLSDIRPERLLCIKVLTESIGTKTFHDEDYISVKTQSDSFRIGFIPDEQYQVMADTLYFPFDELANPEKLFELLKLVFKRLKMGTHNLDQKMALNLDISSKLDENFIINVMLKYVEDGTFISALLLDDTRNKIVQNWYVTNVDIVNLETCELLRRVSRYITHSS